jgi:16S rRNA (cytosine1402-N4)-methyltransferase
LEDRIVKQFMRKQSQAGNLPKELPIKFAAEQPRLRTLSRGTKPAKEEIAANPRSRSVILRVAEKLS